jgi:cytosine/adenosine deaminase-related metal-dependent hydrolase
MLILADALVSTPDRVLRPGRLRVSGRIIQEVGSDLRAHPGEEVLELPGLTLAPGFLNLHAHLELTTLQGKIPPRLPFAEWLRQILLLLPGLHATARTASILETSRAAAESGTTTILTILSDPESLVGTRIHGSARESAAGRSNGSFGCLALPPPRLRLARRHLPPCAVQRLVQPLR